MKSRPKKHVVLALRNIMMTSLAFFLGALFLWAATDEPSEDAWVGILLGGTFLCAAVFAFICFPYTYVFDHIGVKIYYIGCYEYAKWDDIKRIYTSPWTYRSILMVYNISPMTSGKRHRFYMKSEINKNLLTRKYINLYWDGFIDGKPTKKKGFVPPNSDRITAMERDMKGKVREIRDRFKPAFKEYEVFLKADFYPEVADRPLEDYVFECEIEIGDMRDEERRCYLSAPLIDVRCRKKGYEGSIVDGGTEKLENKLNEALSSLKSCGKRVFFEEMDFEDE